MDGEFVIYFIGYSRTPRITETTLQNMFVGRPLAITTAWSISATSYREFIFCVVINVSRQHQRRRAELYRNRSIAEIGRAFGLVRGRYITQNAE
jgi:hypothetical protein